MKQYTFTLAALLLIVGYLLYSLNTASSSVNSNASVPPASSVADQKQANLVAIEVPDMMCPHNCWPEVKNTLVKQAGIVDVKLVNQKNEDEIDDRRVLVTISDEFNAEQVIAALDSAGFPKSKIQ